MASTNSDAISTADIPADTRQTGSFLAGAFRRVELGEEKPKPPESLRLWCSQTSWGLLGGILFGGYRGLCQSRNTSIPSPVPTNSAQHRSTVFFVRESILTGSRVGLFVSIFSATALLIGNSGLTDDTNHAVNYAAAGASTSGLFAASVYGIVPAIAAAAFGASISAAAAMVQQSLQHIIDKNTTPEEPQIRHEDNSVAVVISMIENNLDAHPLRVAARDQQSETGNN